VTSLDADRPTRPDRAGAGTGAGTGARRLSMALAAVAAVGAAATVAVPGVLHGAAAMNGSARGTAAVMLVAGVPALATCLTVGRGRATGRSTVSGRVGVLWLGVLAYMVYNCLLLVFATPFNELFLIYTTMLGLALAALVALVRELDVEALRSRFAFSPGARGFAVFIWVIAAGNTAIWLSAVVPGLFHADRPQFLAGTGLTTNPIYVQDLSVWLPLAFLAGHWLWRGRGWGVALVGGFLAMWALEGLSVAADQWLGSRADPASTVVSSSMVAPFLVLALLCAVVLTRFLRRLPGAMS
jgi:hypothetical protein